MPAKAQKPHITETKGSRLGHIFRRLFHVSILVIPLIYYAYQAEISSFFHLPIQVLLFILLGVFVVLELIRLKLGLVFFGLREYEAEQVSALAWTAVSIILVLLFAEGPWFGVPLIWTVALVDPLLGELRSRLKSRWLVMLLGWLVALAIWWGCAYWFAISLWWGFILAPITVLVESINVRWIDDNALMLLVPLIIIMISSL